MTFSNIIGESVVGANDGSATAQGSGVSGAYTYAWVNSNGIVVGVNATMINLPPDVYTVTVRDAIDQNCVTTGQVTISGGQMPSPCTIGLTFPIIMAETVAGANDGTSTAQGTGVASGNYQYTWVNSNGVIVATTATASNLPPDVYSVTVRDAGNVSCVTVITVTIEPGPVVSADLVLGGRILHPNGTVAITNANVNLTGGLTTSTATNATGNYAFTVTQGGTYTITPFEDDNFDGNNRVNSADLALIIRHITRDTTLTNPYQIIAADTDRNGLIDVRDITNILRAIQGNPFPNNTSWRFIPTNHSPFPAYMRGVPYITTYPESRTVAALTTSVGGQDFFGIKIGDVAADFATSPFRSTTASSRSSSSFELIIQDQLLTVGTTIEVPVRAKNFQGLLGYFASLKMEGNLKLQGVQSGKLAGISMDNFIEMEEEEMLAMFWVNTVPTNLDSEDVLFTLQFAVNEGGQNLSDIVSIDTELIPAFGIKPGAQNAEVYLSFTAAKQEGFELYQNRPNPFTEITTVGFNLPTRGPATINVFDMSGRRIHTVNGEFPKGYSEIQLHSHTLPRNGVLYYELEAAGQIAQKKMIMIDK